ncbi:TPA: hypothetical protein CPT80_02810 [Candidatus Gastranaerophilales bacterium HUM_9]|nr:MAG TPA: hypothetical protein CPT80_02810 [Candidatus Gastranaerophilales bacterium HUM_9]HBX34793.1 hypothetical protein [Cyanobacteria bacterium UBA11440]
MRIQQQQLNTRNYNNEQKSKNNNPKFKGLLDGALTTTLMTLDTNPMANAVGIDLFAMVAPRTYVDTKERNKYAGAETFFREFTGTLIVCLSASYLAKGIAKLANKIINPKTPINPKSWYSKDSLMFLDTASKEINSTKDFVANVFENVSGRDNKNINKFNEINWQNIEWIDENKWNKINWDNKKYTGVHNNLKSKDSIINLTSELINDKTISKKDRKDLLQIIESRMINALGAGNVSTEYKEKTLSTTIGNLLRDTVDFGHDILTNKNVEKGSAINKILKINKIKSVGALVIASTLGLTNQYINRKITEKRTGKKGFVGDNNFAQQVSNNTTPKTTTEQPKKDKKFIAEKLIASLGMIAMAGAVMKVKSPRDFVKKLEFTGPVTSGNAIKTVYASTLIGRFLASDNKDELRESTTRDYLGFLNWLVLGGFASKGVANLLDRKKESLFNVSKEGKGIKHWLNDISLKSHKEIASKGSEFAKRNMWKLNLAHISGLAYSTLALGVLLPKLNIFITNMKNKNSAKSSNASTKRVSHFEQFKNNVLADNFDALNKTV